LGAAQTIRTILKQAQAEITAALELPVNEAKLEAQILLKHSLNVNRAWLISHENDVLEQGATTGFQALLNRRIEGEPVAYILGKREFYGLEFKATSATLIPRPDTETLVEAALEQIPLNKPCRVLDLGTGTGAIAIAIAKHRPLAQVTAVDASAAALAIAQENARNLGASNVQCVLSHWFNELSGQTFDVIVSNPPYIAEADPHLNQGDLRFEPGSALVAGTDGLDCIRQIIEQAPQHLEPQGWLMLEHGYDQAQKVADLMKAAGYSAISSVADLSGVFRVTLCRHLP
jgi:release factor glutamine methyltransferase